jgi:mevalonate kinase
MYSSIICGASWILFLITALWMKSAKNWFRSQKKILDKKKKELDDMILSATDMVHELNNVSDYVVTLIDEKKQDVENTFNEMELRLEECRSMFEGKNVKSENTVCLNEIAEAKSKHAKKQEIDEMFNKGVDVDEIAKKLGVGKGEVQLIIGMQERLCKVG